MKINDVRMDFLNNTLHVTFDSSGDVQAAYDKIIQAVLLTRQEEIDREIIRLCQAGRIIGAIKYYSTQTGLPLKEAKDYVVALYPSGSRP